MGICYSMKRSLKFTDTLIACPELHEYGLTMLEVTAAFSIEGKFQCKPVVVKVISYIFYGEVSFLKINCKSAERALSFERRAQLRVQEYGKKLVGLILQRIL